MNRILKTGFFLCISYLMITYCSAKEATDEIEDKQKSVVSFPFSPIVENSTDIPSLRAYFTEDCLKYAEEIDEGLKTFSGKAGTLVPTGSLAIPLLWYTSQHLTGSELITGGIGAWLLADLESGLIHWGLDNIDGHNKNWPIYVRMMAQEFQWHHDFPYESAKLSYWECARHGRAVAVPLLISGALMSYCGSDYGSFIFTVAGVMGSQVPFIHHRLTHGAYDNNLIVKTLRKLRIIDTRASHNLHHSHPTRSIHYCLFNGHTNFIVDPLTQFIGSTFRFFRNWCGKKPRKTEEQN
mgnify:CR=1 FL=1